MLLCSHLLRDVEQVCDEVVIMKDGMIVHECNLEEERRSNKRFVELEVTGDDEYLRGALPTIGADGVTEGNGRWRIVPASCSGSSSIVGFAGAAESAGSKAHPSARYAGGDFSEGYGPHCAHARAKARRMMHVDRRTFDVDRKGGCNGCLPAQVISGIRDRLNGHWARFMVLPRFSRGSGCFNSVLVHPACRHCPDLAAAVRHFHLSEQSCGIAERLRTGSSGISSR